MLSRVRNASIKADSHEEYKKNLLSDIKKNVRFDISFIVAVSIFMIFSGQIFDGAISLSKIG